MSTILQFILIAAFTYLGYNFGIAAMFPIVKQYIPYLTIQHSLGISGLICIGKLLAK